MLTDRRFRWAVAAWTVVGVAIRFFYVLVRRPTCEGDPAAVVDDSCFRIWGDALYHHSQGRLLADGEWFVNGFEYARFGTLNASAGDPPLYSSFLGVLSAVGLDTGTQHRLASALIGATAIVLIAVLAKRLAGPVAGVVAAALAAIHPMLWVNDIMLMSEALYAPLILLAILAAYRFADRRTTVNVALLGFAIAVAALTRAEALFLFGFLAIPLVLLAAGPLRGRVNLLLVCWGVGFLTLAPWLTFNMVRFEEPTLMSSATGSVLMAGSCDTAWDGPSLGYWALCYEQRELYDDLEAEFPGYGAEPPDRVIYDESVIDVWNREQAFDYISANTGRFPVVASARLGRAFELYRVDHTLQLQWQIEGRGRLPSTLGRWLYYGLLPGTVLGLFELRRRRIPISPLLSQWGAVGVAVVTTFGITRYRVPVDLAMITLTGVAVAALLDQWRASRESPVGTRRAPKMTRV